MPVRPVKGVYFNARKTENLINFPRAKPKPLEIKMCLLNQKIAVPPPEKHFLRVICEV